jgi:alpha-L-arabinofuranosidase
MKNKLRYFITGLSIIVSLTGLAQKRLAEFPFDTHNRAANVNTAIGFGVFTLKVSSQDVVLQAPVIMTDTDDVTKVMYFKFQASYSSSNNNLNIALAPKAGNNVRITHIEFRMRFGSTNIGNAGIFISKDPTMVTNTQIWTCGNNKTFSTYKDFVVPIPASELNYSESPTDSIRFVIAQGTNTQGMYFDNLMVYGIVNGETNPVQNISIDASNVTKDLADRPSGANTCWLMDSDIKWPRTVSNENRFAEMKLGALRFPYGHLADNYLWHTPGEYSTVATTGPKPKVASPDIPAKWTWAVNQTSGAFLKDLSFDEFIAMCKRQNIEPLIVINAQAHTYTGGPTYQTLKTAAVEWVRYANITKGYGVKNWQIGNEVEHQSALTMNAYTSLFIDFATAMKAVDPTIHVGTGVLSSTTWNNDVLTKAGNLCDFVATHNYQHGSSVPAGGYRSWYQNTTVLITNTTTTQNMLNSSFPNRPEIEIHVTETNITGGDFPDMSNIDLYKALYWFEMNMNHLALKNLKYTYFWGSHSPWGGETSLGDISCLLENSNANTIRPAGRVIQLINTYLKNKWVSTTRVKGFVRTYASVSADGKELSVFLLNKNLYAETANLNISNFNLGNVLVEKAVFTSTHFNDTEPVISTEQLTSVPSQVVLSPFSLTVLNFTVDQGNTTVTNPETDDMKMRFDGERLHLMMPVPEDGRLKVYGIDGRCVRDEIIKSGTDNVLLSYLANGVYVVKLQTGNKSFTRKIIK